MGVRSTLSSILAGPAASMLADPIREMVEEALAARAPARQSDIEALRARIDALSREVAGAGSMVSTLTGSMDALKAQRGEGSDNDAALLARVDALGALLSGLDAATDGLREQLGGLSDRLVAAGDALEAATGKADSAAAAAKTAAGKADEVSVRLGTLSSGTPAPAPAPDATAEAAPADAGCRVPGCTRPHRAKGFCGRHYQQWRRGSLEGFPNDEA